MLTNTFQHIHGVGEVIERRLWHGGWLSWTDVEERGGFPESGLPYGLASEIAESRRRLQEGDARFFASRLPVKMLWRLFPDFRGRVGYLDIETTGLGAPDDHITTIALYDGERVRCYVYDINMDDFAADVAECDLLVTYNGKCFDLPFIYAKLGLELTQPHIDLRFLLRDLGYRGGLKGCERQLGIGRGDLEGVDGYFAVLLWREYIRRGSRAALETLLAYNIEDVVNLEKLMVKAYNLSLAGTPFAGSLEMEEPPDDAVPSPFQPDMRLVRHIRHRYGLA